MAKLYLEHVLEMAMTAVLYPVLMTEEYMKGRHFTEKAEVHIMATLMQCQAQ